MACQFENLLMKREGVKVFMLVPLTSHHFQYLGPTDFETQTFPSSRFGIILGSLVVYTWKNRAVSTVLVLDKIDPKAARKQVNQPFRSNPIHPTTS